MERKPEDEVMGIADEAAAYAQADFSHVNQAFVDRLLELIDSPPVGRALDLGTGPADIPIRLVRTLTRRLAAIGGPASALGDFKIVAVDASAAMLDLARKAVAAAGLEGQIELALVDAKRTALSDHSFNVIFSNSILHHITDVAAFWMELKRLAAPRAVVFLRDLARPNDAQAARAIVRTYAASESPLLQEEYYRSLLSAYTLDEVRTQLDRAGLACLQVKMISDRHMDVQGRLLN